MKCHALLTAFLLAASATTLAQTPSPPPPASSFEQHKAAMIAKLQARIAREQALVACLQTAQNRDAARACKMSNRPVH